MELVHAIGNTPMEIIDGVNVKLEYLNPSGSIKDRMTSYIVERAEKEGLLKKGYTIVEATSGNTGISLSMLAALRGYRTLIVMPKGLSHERKQIMEGYGAKVIHPKHNCFSCAIDLAKRYAKKKKFYMPDQFSNPWNENAEERLGNEIAKEAKSLDAFVAGVGTGGTIIGAGRVLKKRFGTKLVAVEPAECALMTGYGIGKIEYYKDQKCRRHGIEGIGDGIVPDIIKRNSGLVDEVMTVSTKEAVAMTRKLVRRGYFVGPSSGANMVAALRLKKKYRKVATVFPDRGDRYLSEKIF